MPGTALAEMSPDRFAMIQRMAQAFCKSELVPEPMRESHGNCVVALLMAEQMGENPLMVMQNIYFVKGRPGWAAQYMVARANNSGKFIGPLRWRTDGAGAEMAVTCYARLRDAPQDDNEVAVTISYAMAVADGWTRNEKYKTIPEQMLVWRSATWLIRRYVPEVMFGLPTVDELDDTLKDVTPRPSMDDFRPGLADPSPRSVTVSTSDFDSDSAGSNPAGATKETLGGAPPTPTPVTAASQPSLQKGEPTQVGLPLSGDAGQSRRPSRAASKPPLIIVSRVGDPDGTADDLIAGLKSSKTLPESNAFIKANGPTIQALPDDAHGHWHEAMTEWLREMEAQ